MIDFQTVKNEILVGVNALSHPMLSKKQMGQLKHYLVDYIEHSVTFKEHMSRFLPLINQLNETQSFLRVIPLYTQRTMVCFYGNDMNNLLSQYFEPDDALETVEAGDIQAGFLNNLMAQMNVALTKYSVNDFAEDNVAKSFVGRVRFEENFVIHPYFLTTQPAHVRNTIKFYEQMKVIQSPATKLRSC